MRGKYMEREEVESQLEIELGWRWQPQMRHAYKMQKLWEKLVAARLEWNKAVNSHDQLVEALKEQPEKLRVVADGLHNIADKVGLGSSRGIKLQAQELGLSIATIIARGRHALKATEEKIC